MNLSVAFSFQAHKIYNLLNLIIKIFLVFYNIPYWDLILPWKATKMAKALLFPKDLSTITCRFF